ncbi:MAG: hypothetical protein HY077_14110 [Elusimicrobia bacterium]|nr:hypothetical protein [Elusimicrobiota bacterium]
MPDLRRLSLLLLLAPLCACATWGKHGVDLKTAPRLRIALLPIRCSAKMKDPVRVAGELAAALSDDLRDRPEFDLVATVLTASTSPLTAAELQALGKQFGAQALLEVDVGGYGKIKTTTLLAHLGPSALKGTVEGALVVGPAGPIAGALVLTYSILEGAVLWTSGTFLFNRIYTPVILDGRLYSAVDGRKIWSDAAMALINSEALKQLPTDKQHDKEARLSLAAEKAAAKLVSELTEETRRNLRSQAPKHGAKS